MLKSIFELLSQQPHWEFDEKKLVLKSADDKIVSLHLEKHGKQASFKLNDDRYEIRRGGFWQRQVVIFKREKAVVILRPHFWGSTAQIDFTKGNRYELKIKNEPTVTLHFVDNTGRDLFELKLMEDNKLPSMVLKIIYHHIPKDEMLFLFILAAFIAHNIVLENTVSKTVEIKE